MRKLLRYAVIAGFFKGLKTGRLTILVL